MCAHVHTHTNERPIKNFRTQTVKIYQAVQEGSMPHLGEQLSQDGGGVGEMRQRWKCEGRGLKVCFLKWEMGSLYAI